MVDVPNKLSKAPGSEPMDCTTEEIRATLPVEIRKRLDDALNRIRQVYKRWDDLSRP